MKHALPALLVLGLVVSPALAADDYPRDWDVDVEHYRFHLTLNDDSNVIEGDAEITVRFARAGIGEFFLDLVGRDPQDGSGMEVLTVSRGDQAVAYEHVQHRLRVRMGSPSGADERRRFSVRYRGVPADGLIIAANMFGDRTFFGDNWPNRARHWLPTVDHVSDKATVEWIVVAPDHYQVVANGRLVELSDVGDGTRRTHWSSTVPLPPKVMVIGAARFAVRNVGQVDDVPVSAWVYPQNRDEGFYDYALAEGALRFFASHVGPYPFAKLANVQSKTRYGGMENAGNIFYSERSVSGTRASEGLIAHEVAHQWFGDSVTERDWHHIWLSEGFATYFTQLYNEFVHGRDEMVRGMQGARSTVLAFYAANPELPVIAEQLTDPNELLNRNAYQKGAWVLHMLRRQVGDEAFWAGIRDYYRVYRGGNALTEDLQSIMENASGQELRWFFDQWTRVPGHPVISGQWSYDAAADQVQLHLTQTQASTEPFRFALDIGLDLGADAPMRVETVQMDRVEQTFTIAAGKAPIELTLDPNTWLLFDGGISRR